MVTRLKRVMVILLAMAGLVGCMPTPTLTPAPTFTPMLAPTLTPAPTATPEAARWQRLDTSGGGGQTAVAFHPTDPDVVYMASDNGGLFKTENGGDTWFSVSSNMGAYMLGFVTLDPLNPDVVYVAASTDYGAGTLGGATGEIQRSLDGGQSWALVSGEMGFQNSFPNQASIVIPAGFDRDGDRLSDVIVVAAWSGPADPAVGGIWRSDDEGETFAHLALKDRNMTALRAFGGDVNVLFATTYEGEVYRSEDLGENWVDISGDLSVKHLSDLAVHPTDRGILYVTNRWCRAGEPAVWKTTDGGEHWQAASGGLDSQEIEEFPKILMDRFDPNTLYVTVRSAPASVASVYQTMDGGDSWQPMAYGLVLPDGRPFIKNKFQGKIMIGQAVDGRLFADGTAAWRYPAGDGRQEWEPATIGVGNVRVNAIAVDPHDPTVLYQGISDQGPYKSVDRGASFHHIVGNGWPVTVDNYVWNGPYFSNYKECALPCSVTCAATGQINQGGTTDFAISRQDARIVYSAFGSGSNRSDQGGVNKSTDGGVTWQPVGFQLGHGFDLNRDCVPYGFRHLAMDPADDRIVFAAQENTDSGAGKLYRTADGGATWAEVYAGSGEIKGLEVSAVDSSLVVMATYSGVYRSEQGGEAGSWQAVDPPGVVGIRTVALSPHKREVVVIGTNDGGLYYTADGGMSWRNNDLQGFFAQEDLGVEVATVVNPKVRVLKSIEAIVFDPVVPDVFYVGGSQHKRASVGVARISNAGQDWQRLPLAGLSHRNVYDLAVDSAGEFLYAGTFDGTFRFKLR